MVTPKMNRVCDTRAGSFSSDAVKYVIITPARNEADHIEETIASLAQQTICPEEWIVVDDGSTDKTGEILDQAAEVYPWIRVLHLPDRGFREPGSGVIRAFNQGLANLKTSDWHFIVKLDADLVLPRDYFEKCFEQFRQDPTLAVGGGTICHDHNGTRKPDHGPRFHVRGATKIYRREFWDASGGLYPVAGWDTIDEVKANQLNWTSRSFPDIEILHRRITGSADGIWKNWFKNGRANYVTGYHPLFMVLKCLGRVRERPIFIAALALFCGFVSGYLKKLPQVGDRELIRYVRDQQVRKMLFQKTIWK